MDKIKEFLVSEFQDKEARDQYAEDFLSSRIALQIKTLRLQQNLSQVELAKRAGLRQSQISSMEQISHRAWKISTLQKVASALDLALLVDFASFSDFLDASIALDKESLERRKFAHDVACHEIQMEELESGEAMAPVVDFPGRTVRVVKQSYVEAGAPEPEEFWTAAHG